MFIREKVTNVFGLVLVSLIAQGTFAFSGEEVYVPVNPKAIDFKAIREKEERGLNLAKKAIKLADPYPGMKTDAEMRNNELGNLVERKKYLTATVQRLQIGLMNKKAKFARNPELLKVSVKQYTQKIAEMKDELAEVEKLMPTLESKLASVNLELQVEELARGIMVDEEDTEGFDEEFEVAIQERFSAGMVLLNKGF
ncbi:MAG: hypothetical protein HOG49_10930 [Candidatus Scalindua sp.]|jgi:hypothetical protein|nr:hypothetical protein [Candidatus Scalindua sp.]